ncbi:hypothetical protein EVAR_32172_1 [Eumeta japonica]|uniref:Uncharacterized protein n=1 Tax=Eumeta variegata TaxID=151549 RepID=A0A4C1VWH8_EUMVA|nr:hypothetical protein EVAR_32172_1 [Eumeta japonica]
MQMKKKFHSGLGGLKINQKITKMQKKLDEAKKQLANKKRNAEYQKSFRKKRQALIKDVIKNPVAKQQLNVHETVGCPRLEEAQLELLKVLAEIASFGGGADEKRRTEMIRSCRTLDDLVKELEALGFNLSRSATYLRLLPRCSTTIQGKKHVVTVPVKLVRATNDEHKSHPDGKFCTASIRAIESLASMLGPAQVFFLSQDDKARIPIGKTAVEKQAPFLMHMEYRVRLPDHDWVVAEKHKLIPSVYAGIEINTDGMGRPEAVTYSGPTHVAIRSGKHSSSSARTHSIDLEHLMELIEFQSLAKTDYNSIKPVIIMTVDGGPDENPRFPQVIFHAISHFRKFDLDAIFIITNAPGRSCFNRVERRMAPLSHQLSGLVLPYDFFGNHLDDQRRTIDNELELKNFKMAGNILAQIWSKLTIDDKPVGAEYVDPASDNIDKSLVEWTPDWYCRHVREFHKYQCARTENFRPIKLLHRRAGQSLCLTSYNNNILDIEWYDNEDIGIEKIEVPQEEHEESVIPVIESISEWFHSTNPGQNCDRLIRLMLLKLTSHQGKYGTFEYYENEHRRTARTLCSVRDQP